MTKDEKYKIGYSGAISMTSVESTIIWSAFRTLIGANALLVTFVGAAMKLYPDKLWLPIVMSLVGIVVCILWFLTLTRQFSYCNYWIAWAKYLEKKTLAPDVEMFEKGKSYGEGAEVEIGEQNMRMPWFGRWFKVQWLMSGIIFT